DGEERGEPAGDAAEPRRAEAGGKAERGHGEVVERVPGGVALERLVETGEYDEHHQRWRADHGREARARLLPQRPGDGRQRAEQEAERDAEQELAGVVEMVEADVRVGGVDDLREEGGQGDDERGGAERELGWAGERETGVGERFGRRRLVRAAADARLVAASGPAVGSLDERVAAP